MNKMIGNIDAYLRTIIQLLSASIIMIPYLVLTHGFTAASFTPHVVLLVLIVGIVHTGIAYAMYFASIEGLKGQTVALLSYMDPVSALFFSALILHESLGIEGLIGAIMIIGAAIVSER